MLTTERRRLQCQRVAELAREVLGDLARSTPASRRAPCASTASPTR